MKEKYDKYGRVKISFYTSPGVKGFLKKLAKERNEPLSETVNRAVLGFLHLLTEMKNMEKPVRWIRDYDEDGNEINVSLMFDPKD